jgi:hypothetical protein
MVTGRPANEPGRCQPFIEFLAQQPCGERAEQVPGDRGGGLMEDRPCFEDGFCRPEDRFHPP